MSAKTTAKNGPIQALRALAISAVFIYHLKATWLRNGFLGVDMFFVISGFLMTQILSKSGINKATTAKFFTRRIKRIVPLYLITILCVLLYGRQVLASKDIRILNTDSLWSLFLVSNMQSVFHQYDYFEELTSYKLLVHTWSLSVELQYYLVVPLLMFILFRMSRRSRIVVALILVMISWVSNKFFASSISFGILPCRIWQFLIGFLTFQFSDIKYDGWRARPKYQRVNPRYDSASKQEDCIGLLDDTKEDTTGSYRKSNISCWPLYSYTIFAAAICSCALTSGFVEVDRAFSTLLAGLVIYFSTKAPAPLLSVRPLVYLGDISYVFYLAHWPVITFLKYLNDEIEISMTNVVLAFLITSVISVGIHHTIEQRQFSFIAIGGLYLVCFTLMALPVAKLPALSGIMSSGNATKDCAALSVTLQWPKDRMENYSEDPPYHGKYGEINGTGKFDVVVIGNSFTREGFPWFFKAFNGRYRRMYALGQDTCWPFLNHTKLKDNNPKTCEPAFTKELALVERVKPKILFMSIGYNHLFAGEKVVDAKTDRFVVNAIENLKKYSEWTDYIIIDTPPMSISYELAGKLIKAVEKHTPIPARNTTRYSFQQYLGATANSWPRIEEIRRNCPKCRFIEIQSTFCQDDYCDPFDYDCSQPLYWGDGFHMFPFTYNLLYPKYKAAIDTAIFLAQRGK